jgi:predicted metal-binding protein
MNKENNKIQNIEVGWSESVIMICTKCAKQFDSIESQDSVERIKGELKNITKRELDNGTVRVITTSCLNICPVNKIAIATACSNKVQVFDGFAVDTCISGQEIFDHLYKK